MSARSAQAPDPRDAPRAVLQDESLLDVAVQPILDLADATVAGWECLSRPAARLGTDPRRLFDDAAAAGLSGELHATSLRRALALRASVPPQTFLTVNVDPVALCEPAVVRVLEDAGDLRGVFVELTEQDWPDDDAAVVARVRALQEQGALVAMDDVGAGYAGLSRVLQVRPQLIKLDRALVAGLGEDPASRALVRSVGELAARLDAWILVEGVERETQLRAAADEGVPLGQGYLLGRPAPPWPAVDVEPLRRVARARQAGDTVSSLLRAPDGFRVVLDDAGRPVRVGATQPDGSWWFHPVLSTAPSTGVREALERALTRPAADRFAPVLVTDREGTLLGGVLVEDLVAHLTREVGRAAAPGPPAPRRPDDVVDLEGSGTA